MKVFINLNIDFPLVIYVERCISHLMRVEDKTTVIFFKAFFFLRTFTILSIFFPYTPSTPEDPETI